MKSSKEKVIADCEWAISKILSQGYTTVTSMQFFKDVIAHLKHPQEHEVCENCPHKQESLLGIQQTADGITFISTGTAQQGEERGLMLGKLTMHEWLKKELLYRGLLTDEIREVFDEAKRI